MMMSMLGKLKVLFLFDLVLDLQLFGLVTVLTVNLSISKQCEFPVISFSFFNETVPETKRTPLLYTVESSIQGKELAIIPYQYFLLTCSAHYPIEWVVENSVPQHYYFSYVLDDERRLFEENKGGNGQHTKGTELFKAWQHIGNETLAKVNVTQLSAFCKPAHEDELDRCGETWIKIDKDVRVNDTQGPGSTTFQLAVSFDFTNTSKKLDHLIGNNINDQPSCFKWSTSFANQNDRNNSNKLKCQSLPFEESHFTNGFKFPLNLGQLSINESNLINPRGLLSCDSRELPNELKFSKMDGGQEMYTFPYFYSLSQFCPNEDPTLPHLYFMSKPLESFTSCLTTEDEEMFLSFCVRNLADDNNAIYLGDNVTVTCISSIFYFAEGMKISEIRDLNQNRSSNAQKRKYISQEVRELANGRNGYRNLTMNIPITDNTVKEFECEAPVRKSRKWKKKVTPIQIRLPVKPSFQHDHKVESGATELYLVCNASGDPLPILSWSRPDNGKIPENQTNNSSGSWTSSKLHFPKDSSKQDEYLGSYICTAKNRFHSISDTNFLFGGPSTKESQGLAGFWTIVIGSIVILIVVINVIIFLGWKLRKQAKNLRLFTTAEINEFIFGRPELLLPGGEYEEINSYAAYLPYDRNRFEIKRDQLEFDLCDVLGSGAYGTVYRGVFKNPKEGNQEVAIKTVDASSDKIYFASLLSEIKIMCYIGKHENVVELIGACTKYLNQRQIFVATEFCSNGDLLSYIQRYRDAFINNAGKLNQGELETQLTTKTVGTSGQRSGRDGYCRLTYARRVLSPHLLRVWALKISQGMVFLSNKKVIHGDLAARNILLTHDLKPKIGDFGLSKRIQSYTSYVRKDDDFVPWRWLAIESLQFMKYSIKSDVWAFAVVLFELFSLGQVPYANYNFSELFIVSLCQGERLQKPNFADNKVYNLMLDCWKYSPEERPSFQEIEEKLRNWVTQSESSLMNPSNSNAEDHFINTPPGSAELSKSLFDETEDGFHTPALSMYTNMNGNVMSQQSTPQNSKGYVESVPVSDNLCKPRSMPNEYIVDWNAMK